jgi:hypothetical protein
MALYHFDVDDNGTMYHDDVGTECADFAQVKHEAIAALAEMMRDSLPDGDHHRLTIKVRDEGGELVLQAALRFEMEAQPPSSRGRSSTPDSHV